jgi:hypothetical protein
VHKCPLGHRFVSCGGFERSIERHESAHHSILVRVEVVDKLAHGDTASRCGEQLGWGAMDSGVVDQNADDTVRRRERLCVLVFAVGVLLQLEVLAIGIRWRFQWMVVGRPEFR